MGEDFGKTATSFLSTATLEVDALDQHKNHAPIGATCELEIMRLEDDDITLTPDESDKAFVQFDYQKKVLKLVLFNETTETAGFAEEDATVSIKVGNIESANMALATSGSIELFIKLVEPMLEPWTNPDDVAGAEAYDTLTLGVKVNFELAFATNSIRLLKATMAPEVKQMLEHSRSKSPRKQELTGGSAKAAPTVAPPSVSAVRLTVLESVTPITPSHEHGMAETMQAPTPASTAFREASLSSDQEMHDHHDTNTQEYQDDSASEAVEEDTRRVQDSSPRDQQRAKMQQQKVRQHPHDDEQESIVYNENDEEYDDAEPDQHEQPLSLAKVNRVIRKKPEAAADSNDQMDRNSDSEYNPSPEQQKMVAKTPPRRAFKSAGTRRKVAPPRSSKKKKVAGVKRKKGVAASAVKVAKTVPGKVRSSQRVHANPPSPSSESGSENEFQHDVANDTDDDDFADDFAPTETTKVKPAPTEQLKQPFRKTRSTTTTKVTDTPIRTPKMTSLRLRSTPARSEAAAAKSKARAKSKRLGDGSATAIKSSSNNRSFEFDDDEVDQMMDEIDESAMTGLMPEQPRNPVLEAKFGDGEELLSPINFRTRLGFFFIRAA
jgi:hypothetical protein